MEEYKKLIYDLMNGKLDFKDNPPEECKYVKDEFSMNSQWILRGKSVWTGIYRDNECLSAPMPKVGGGRRRR